MVDITRLTGGNTPADGGDPRTFPAIWNATATSLESALAEAPVTVSATAPASPVNGDLWWDTVNEGLFMYYTGVDPAEWIVAGGGGGGASVTISSTAPADPTAGDMWWDSDNGNLYIYYDDGTSQQWVAGNGPQVFVGTAAPAGYQGQLWFDSTTGKVYIYYDDGTSAQWVAAVGGQNIQSSDLPAGTVLQVVSTAKVDKFTTTSTTPVDITGLTATITPSSTSSKILILIQLQMSVSNGADHAVFAQIGGGNAGTYIGDQGDTNQPRAVMGTLNNTSSFIWRVSGLAYPMNYLDSPSTTSPVTYAAQIFAKSGSTAYVNSTGTDTNYTHYARGASSITLIEVAG